MFTDHSIKNNPRNERSSALQVFLLETNADVTPLLAAYWPLDSLFFTASTSPLSPADFENSPRRCRLTMRHSGVFETPDGQFGIAQA